MANRAVAVPNTAPVSTTPRGAPFGNTAETSSQLATTPTGHAAHGRSRARWSKVVSCFARRRSLT